MQIDIDVKTYSTKQRILAFFMAFMIFSLTFSQGLENLGVGLIVHSAATANTMTIREVTDFSSVNDGLKTLTEKAAEKDVFKYTVSNDGAGASGNDVKTPTYDTYTRTNQGISTTLTGQTLVDTTYSDANAIFLEVGMWDVSNATEKFGAWIWKNGSNGTLYIGEQLEVNGEVQTGIYRFSGFPTTGNNAADRVKFLRLDGSKNYSTSYPDGSNIWDQTGDLTLYLGKKFSINGWSSGSWSDNAYTVEGGIQYDDEKPFTPSGGSTLVKDTAYEWKEAFSTRTDTSVTGQNYDDIGGYSGGKYRNEKNRYSLC